MVTRIGDRMASAQIHVGVAYRHEREHVPIPHQPMVETTAVLWDLTLLAENAAFKDVQVSN